MDSRTRARLVKTIGKPLTQEELDQVLTAFETNKAEALLGPPSRHTNLLYRALKSLRSARQEIANLCSAKASTGPANKGVPAAKRTDAKGQPVEVSTHRCRQLELEIRQRLLEGTLQMVRGGFYEKAANVLLVLGNARRSTP